MPESSELFSELANIRDKVDDISRTVSALTRQSGYREKVLDAMRVDPALRSVFLLVDGVRTQAEIVKELGIGQATVSRKLDTLIEDWDLVRRTTRDKNGVRYVHTSLARDLRIERALKADKSGKKMPPAGGMTTDSSSID